MRKPTSALLRGFFLALATFVGAPALATSGPSNFNISGGLFQASGTPVTQSSVNFKLEVWDPAGTCLLYSEEHPGQNLSQTKGGFSLQVGAGSNKNNYVAGSAVMTSKVFENNGALTGGWANCPVGPTLNSGDQRLIRVYYDLGGGYTAMTPDVPIVAAAYSMVAETLQGKRPADFLQPKQDMATDLDQTNLETVFSSTNYARLLTLLSSSGAFSFGSQRITNLADPTAAQDAATKNYSDSRLAGQTIDLQNVGVGTGGGKVLTWDQAQNKWVAMATSTTDATKLPLDGSGVMTGALQMGAQNITNVGNIQMAAQRSINLGTFDNAQEGVLVGTLGPANEGAFWYNSQDNVLKVWNGTAAISQAGLTAGKLAASMIPDTTVAPGGSFGSATQVPTFTVGADGRLTAAANVTIAGVAPGGAAGGDLTGTYPNPDIAANAVTGAEIANDAVGTTEIANDAVTSAKLNSTGIGVNRLLITDATTGATVTYKTCANDEVLKYTATGWACATVASLSPVKTVEGRTGDIDIEAADISDLGTAALRFVGTSVGNVVEVIAGGKLPVLDGSNLTNINAVQLQGRNVAATAPNNTEVLTWNGTAWAPAALPASATPSGAAGGDLDGTYPNPTIKNAAVSTPKLFANPGVSRLVATNATDGSTLAPFVCAVDEVPVWTALGWDCLAVADIVATSFRQGGNSFGATAVLGTNDTHSLQFETDGTAKMTILADGKVGIGTATPNRLLEVAGPIRVGAAALPAGAAGDIVIDSGANNSLKWHNGTSWQTVQAAAGGSGFALAGANADITSMTALTAINGAGNLAINAGATNTLTVGSASTGAATFGHTGAAAVTTLQGGSGAAGQAVITSAGTAANAVAINATGVNGGITLTPNGTGVVTSASPVVITGAALPTGSAGMIAVDSGANNTLKWHNGTSWQTVQAAAGGSGYALAGANADITSMTALTSISGATIGISGTTALNLGSTAGAAATVLQSGTGGTSITSTGTTASAVAITVSGTNGGITLTPNGTGVVTSASPVVITGAALPTGSAGMIAIDSGANNSLKFHNGTSWQTVQIAAGGSGFALAGANADITSMTALTAINGAGNLAINAGATNTLTVGSASTGAATFGHTGAAAVTTLQGGSGAAGQAVITSAGTAANAVAINATGVNGGITLTPNGTGVVTSASPVVITGAALPTGSAGMIAVDSGANNTLKWHNGTSWQTVQAAAGGSGFALAGANADITSMTALTSISGATIGISGTTALNLGSTAGAAATVLQSGTGGTSITSTGTTASAVAVTVSGTNGGITLTPNGTGVVTSASPVVITGAALPTGSAGMIAVDSGANNTLKWHNGTSWQTVATTAGLPSADSLDFSELKDAMVLDASTDISATGTNALSITNSGTGASFRVNDQAGDTTPFIILDDGKVGVGTATPASTLDVVGTIGVSDGSAAAPSIRFASHPNTGIHYLQGTVVPRIALAANGVDALIADQYGITVTDGSAAYPAYSFNNTFTSGWFHAGSDNFGFSVAGAEKLRIASSGSIGIGTTAPNQLLTVEGPMSLRTQAAPTATANYGKIYVDSGDANKLKYMNPAGTITDLTAAGSLPAADSLDFTHFADSMTLDTSTDIAATGTNALSITNSGTGASFRVNDQVGDTTPFIILDDGNVGIGTTTPNRLLEVAGPIRVGAAALPAGAAGDIVIDSGANNSLKWHNGTSWQTVQAAAGGSGFALAGANADITSMTALTSISGATIGISGTTALNLGSTAGAAATVLQSGTGGTSITSTGTTASAVAVTVSGTNGGITLTPNGTGVVTSASPVVITGAALPTGSAGMIAVDSGANNTLKWHNGTSWQTVQAAAGGSGFALAGANADITSMTALTAINGAGNLAINAGATNTLTVGSASTGAATFGHTGAAAVTTLQGGSGAAGQTVVTSAGTAANAVAINATGVNGGITLTPNGTGVVTSASPVVITGAALPTGSAGMIAVDSGANNTLKWHNGTSWQTVATTAGLPSADSLDFSELKDAMVLDASTDISATGTNALSITNSGTGASFRINDAAGDTTPFLIDDAGQVGIGTTSPTKKLQVVGAAGSNVIEANCPNDWCTVQTTTGGVTTEMGGNSTDGSGFAGTTSNHHFAIESNGVERMRFDTSGNVGIGTTAPNQLLTVEGPMSLRTQAAPTATANYGKLYVDSGDSNKLKYMNPAGTITDLSAAGGAPTADSLDFTHFADSMTLDASTDIAASGTNEFSITNGGTGLSFRVNDATGGDTTPFAIDAAGNVGIGMTAPTHTLSLAAGSNKAMYNAFTDTSNYERGFERWSANEYQLGTEAAGTGTVRNMKVGTYGTGTVNSTLTLAAGEGASGGTGNIYLKANGTTTLNMNQFLSTFGTSVVMGTNTLYGGTGSGSNLTIDSTTHATKGNIILNASGGNVGIGTASPNQKLTVEGPMSLRTQAAPTATANYGKLYVDSGDSNKLKYMNPAGAITDLTAGGTPSADSLDFTHFADAMTLDASTDIAASGTNELSITNGGTGLSFRVNDATGGDTTPFVVDASGNVGIGTTTPGESLTVVNSSTNQISVQGPSYSEIAYKNSSGTVKAWTGYDTASDLTFVDSVSGSIRIGASTSVSIEAGGSPRISVLSTGNVGIGTASPNQKLTVEGPMSLRRQAAPTATANYGKIYVDSGDSNKLKYMNPAGAITDLSTGAAPGADSLDFTHFADAMTLDASTSISVTGSNVLSVTNSGTGDSFRVDDAAGDTTPFVVDSSGNVGVGTPTPDSLLHVESAAAWPQIITQGGTGNDGVSFTQINDSGYEYSISVSGSTNASPGANTFFIWNDITASIPFVIKPSGNVGIGTTAPDERLVVDNGSTTGKYTTTGWTHSSDIRLKHDIAPLENSLDKILKLQGVEYVFNEDSKNKKQIGFIAQQVEPIFPEVVTTDEDGFKSMVYANLVAPLVESVKALYNRIVGIENHLALQDREIEALKAEVKAKEQKIKELEQRDAEMKDRLDKIEKMLSR